MLVNWFIYTSCLYFNWLISSFEEVSKLFSSRCEYVYLYCFYYAELLVIIKLVYAYTPLAFIFLWLIIIVVLSLLLLHVVFFFWDLFLVAKLCMKWQFDELVVQAFKLKSTSERGRIEIESFTHFLSEMLSSLKVNPTFYQYITLLFPYILFLIWVIISQNVAMASQISEGSLQSFGRVWKSVGTDWGKQNSFFD